MQKKDKNSRTCNQPGHEHYSPYMFCTFDQCKALSRWCCIQCITTSLHEHGQQNKGHIISEESLKKKLINYDMNQKEAKQIISPLVDAFKVLEKQLHEIKDQISQALQNLNPYEDQLELQSYLYELEDGFQIEDHNLLDYYNKNEQVSKITNTSQISYYFENLQQQFYQFELKLKDCQVKQARYQNQQYDQATPFNQSKSNFQSHESTHNPFNIPNQQYYTTKSSSTQGQLQQQNYQILRNQSPNMDMNKFFDYSKQESTQTIRQQRPLLQLTRSSYQQMESSQAYQANQARQKEYQEYNQDNHKIRYGFKEIDKTTKCYNATSISNNELYLAYGGKDRILNEFQIIKSIICCQFTDDSSKLFVGSQKCVYGLDSNNNFKLIYQQDIHLHWVSNIVTIQNRFIITCSADNTIIKTDVITKQQIFKLVGHMSYVKTIDYNDKDDIIISGSTDKSIKLWNCKTKTIIIDKLQSHENDIIQIQLSKNKENILSLDKNGYLYNWRIDLTNKNLIKIQEFIDQNKIYTFYQVNQGQNLIMVCNKYVKILKNNGDVETMINHDCVECKYYYLLDVSDRDCKQLDNMKYIITRASRTILLGKLMEN
ncbi:hypothetical protein pb186bvf_015261 [Paramecium bursaria]